MIGKQILHYKIIEKLGEGGMGIVYKAEDTKLNREVAIKILPPHLLVSEEDRARFNREAKAAAALNHSNIATVFEINEAEGNPFIVMEFIPGATLDQIIVKGPMGLKESILITIQIAEGLHAAHIKDVVHRDIKASNILLSTENQAKILDFGLAKTSISTKLTQMGTTIGTVAYMSPEQVKGVEVDYRTDLWSLGVLLYEMIAGRLPFKAEYDQAVFYSIQNENPDPLTGIRSGVPMSLEWVVNKLMAKNPDERYQSAKDIIIDLKAVDINNNGFSRSVANSTQKTVVTGKKIKKAGNPYKPLALVASLFLLFFISQYFFLTGNSGTESLHFNISAIGENKAQLLRTDIQMLTISPDGRNIAYCVVENAVSTLYMKSLDDFKTRKFNGLGNVGGEPFFSTDGNWIVINADGQLKRVSLTSNTVDVIYDKPAFRGAAWGLDNKIIYTPSYGSGLAAISLSGKELQIITTLDSSRGERTHRWPQVLPDGKHILFTIGNVNSPNSYEDAELAILSLNDNIKHILSFKGEMARYIEPGYLVIAKSGKLLVAPFDLDSYTLLADPIPILSDIEGDLGSGISYFSISDNGHIVYLSGSRNQSLQLAWVDKKGKPESLNLPENPFMMPRISPDGKSVLVNIGTQSASRDIWIYNIESGLFRRLTFGMSGLYPQWSKVDKAIYYMNIRGSSVDLTYLSLENGSTKSLHNFSANTATSVTAISGDDKYLILNTVGEGNGWKLAYFNQHTKEIIELKNTGINQTGGSFSPDTKFLAYMSDETNVFEIYVTNFPQNDLKWQISENGGFSPRWSGKGNEIYYINNNGKLMVVPIKFNPGFQSGKPKELFDVSEMVFQNDNNDNYDVSSDDGKFLMVRNSTAQGQNSLNYIYNWTVELDNMFEK